MTEFFKNTNKIKLIDIPNAGIIRSVSELFSGITNKFNEIIEQGKKLLPSIKIPDNLKLPVNTKLLGTIPRSLPKALASNPSSTLPRGSQVVTSAVQQTNKMNPGLEFLDPFPGFYSIWVGTYGGEFEDAELRISEVSLF